VFDTILAKYAGAKSWAEAGEEIQKAAEGAQGTMKEYYLKAIAKITGNPEYAMKEQSRLAGILKKGGLAAEKIDDLQRRSNVLAKFLVKDGESGSVADEGKSEL
jgi:protein disulfide-isomerase A6